MQRTDTERKRVLVLTSSYPRFAGDTSSIFLQYLYQNMEPGNYDIHVIAPDDRHATQDTLNGIAVHRFRYFIKPGQRLAYGSGIVHNLREKPLNWFLVPLFVISMAMTFFWYAVKFRPSVVHSHWLAPMGFIAGLFKPIFKYRNIVTSHGSDIHTMKGALSLWLKSFTIKRADVWTINSESSAEEIRKIAPDIQPVVIPMGVATDLFEAADRSESRQALSCGNNFIILFVGRLVRQKGVQDLLSAFQLLSSEVRSNSRLWIAGDGVFRKELEQLSTRLNLDQEVTFLGTVSHSELPAYYSAADLFVAPSIIEKTGDTESQGVVYLEAFASHTPVIATAVGGVPDIVKHEVNGLLVQPGRVVDLAEAIKRIYSDRSLGYQLAEAGYGDAKNNYDWKILARRFCKIYTLPSESSSAPND